MRVRSIIGLFGLLLVAACSESFTDEELVARAEQQLAQGNHQAAIIELKNALLQNQRNAEARLVLAQVQLDIGNASSAEKEIQHASQLGMSAGAVQPILARALLAQGKYSDLQSLSVDPTLTPDAQAAVLASQGLGLLAEGEQDKAELQIEGAMALAPESAYSGLANAKLFFYQRDLARMREELERVLSANENYAPAWSLLGDLETREKHWEEAELAYSKAIDNSSDIFLDLVKRATARIRQEEYVLAQEDIDLLRKSAPQHAHVHYLQGVLHVRKLRWPEARDSLDRALGANDGHRQTHYYLGLVHHRLSNLALAEGYAKRFHNAAPLSVPGRKLLAAILFGVGKYAEAEEVIRPVVDFEKDDIDAINLLSGILLKQDKKGEAIGLLREVADQNTESARAQFRLAAGLIEAGEQREGLEYLEKSLALSPDLAPANVLLVQNYVNQKAFDKALVAAEAFRDRRPRIVGSHNMVGHVQHLLGDDAAAAAAFAQAIKLSPGDVMANHAMAGLAVNKREFAEARPYYQTVLNYRENHLSTLLKLVVLDGLEKNEEAMLEHLQQALEAHPNSLQAKVLLAHYYLADADPDKVASITAELSKAEINTPAVLEVTARSQLARGQYREAESSLEQLIEQVPSSVLAHFLMSGAKAGLADRAGMVSELEKTLELDPRHFVARVGLTRLYLSEGDQQKAEKELAVLSELAPDHPQVLQLKASFAGVSGDPAEALELLEQVFKNWPGTATMLSVSRQKWALGDEAGALMVQKQWLSEHPEDSAAALALAGSFDRNNQVDDAISQYQFLLDREEKSVVALNNLAWHLREDDPAQALEYAERAMKLHPGSPAIMDTLALVLLGNGDVLRAKRLIASALQQLPKHPNIRYHSAMIDAAAGDTSLAITALEQLLAESEDFPEREEAQDLLEELLEGG